MNLLVKEFQITYALKVLGHNSRLLNSRLHIVTSKEYIMAMCKIIIIIIILPYQNPINIILTK